jgi:hypothetical protein
MFCHYPGEEVEALELKKNAQGHTSQDRLVLVANMKSCSLGNRMDIFKSRTLGFRKSKHIYFPMCWILWEWCWSRRQKVTMSWRVKLVDIVFGSNVFQILRYRNYQWWLWNIRLFKSWSIVSLIFLFQDFFIIFCFQEFMMCLGMNFLRFSYLRFV